MILSVHQPQYIPWLGFFAKIAASDMFVFLDQVQYKAREYQNRNKIRTRDGSLWLTVPVLSKGVREQRIGDVRIDNTIDWQKKHWNTLLRAYAKAAFFKQYADFFEQVYTRPWEKLIDLNIHIIKYILDVLTIQTPLYYESALPVSSTKTDRIIDICRACKADIYLSGMGGKDYLEEDKFHNHTIRLIYQNFQHPVYNQHTMKAALDFIPYLSVIDLLFNEGVQSRDILLLNSFQREE